MATTKNGGATVNGANSTPDTASVNAFEEMLNKLADLEQATTDGFSLLAKDTAHAIGQSAAATINVVKSGTEATHRRLDVIHEDIKDLKSDEAISGIALVSYVLLGVVGLFLTGFVVSSWSNVLPATIGLLGFLGFIVFTAAAYFLHWMYKLAATNKTAKPKSTEEPVEEPVEEGGESNG